MNHPKVGSFSQRGPLTPDHVIRTKRLPLYTGKGTTGELDGFLTRYTEEYGKYFERNEKGRGLTKLDPLPRVFLVPGIGVITAGATWKDARIASDIYSHTVKCILQAEKIGEYEALPESDIFDVEYWVLEQAKLKKKGSSPALAGKSAFVTGGASGIGLAIAKMLLDQGAQVTIGDLRENKEVEPRAHWVKMDVSSRSEVAAAFTQAVKRFGGLDVVVVNAGIFPKSHAIEDIPLEDWEKCLRINLDGSLHTVAEGLRWMKAQKLGGDIVFIASKNATAPGKKAAAYSVAKAGQTQLARVCALEAGEFGIRVNSLHPHLVLDTGIWSEEVIAERAKAYNLTPQEYRTNNLLRTEISSQNVAQAVFALVNGSFSKTTGSQIPLDGGSDRTL